MTASTAGRAVLALLVLTTGALLFATASHLAGIEVPETIELPTQSGLAVGVRAPEYRLATTGGDSLSLSELRGRVVLVSFWATWCGPCRLELPQLQKLYEQYRDRGVEIAAISVDRRASEVAPFARRLCLSFPVLLGDAVVRSAYRVMSLPSLFIIDRAGVIRYRHTGYAPGMEGVVAEHVEALLAER